ncbi:MAG: hypothetical protein R2798_01100 [Chitinophagales bacterium]|nr:hypothetical protein [Bacteroidota bacterium]MCB9043000.1 hypothetical protein [Chitinophagales bacterium]
MRRKCYFIGLIGYELQVRTNVGNNKFYVFGIFFFLFIGCTSKGGYLTSQDGTKYLTLFDKIDNEGKSYTYITYGKIKENKIPNSYIKVRNRDTDAWYCLITWEENKFIVYQPYSDFIAHQLGNKIELREMKDIEFSKIFFTEKNNKYIRLSSYNKNSLYIP